MNRKVLKVLSIQLDILLTVLYILVAKGFIRAHEYFKIFRVLLHLYELAILTCVLRKMLKVLVSLIFNKFKFIIVKYNDVLVGPFEEIGKFHLDH